MVAETDVWASTMLPGPITCTVPPLNKTCPPVLVDVGVAVIVTVAVEPDCSEGRLQLTTGFVDAPPHVPELTLAVTLVKATFVTVWLILAVMVMLLAKSGPLLVTV